MDLDVARKSLSKRSAFSTKKIAFVAAAGLVLVGGIALRASNYFGEPSAESEPAAPEAAASPSADVTKSVPETPPAIQQAAPVPSAPAATQQSAPTPSQPAATQAGDAAEQPAPEENATGDAEQADLPGAGMILVARKPVQVLASPSATAPAMYGFPAGRPFRVIGREGSFVQIKDLRSSASGWIDATALAAPAPSARPVPAPRPSPPSAVAPVESKPGAVRKPATASADPKPKAAKKGAPALADSEQAAEADPGQARRPPSLFGRGGFFGGVFGGGNAN